MKMKKNIEMSPQARKYLSNVISLIRRKALYGTEVDWDQIEGMSYALANGAVRPSDTFLALKYVASKLGDEGHSRFFAETEFLNSFNQKVSQVSSSAKLIDNGIGYINIPGFASVSASERHKFANSIADQINSLGKMHPFGWIVDLRENEGGAMWPMLAGLSSLIGDGKVGAFWSPSAAPAEWKIKNGTVFLARSEQEEMQEYEDIHDKVPIPKNTPIAVLIGSNTISSGEAVAISFIGKENVKLFGEETAGYSTAVNIYRIAFGGCLLLTETIFSDRNGKIYGGKIRPDYSINSENPDDLEKKDEVIQAAINWLTKVRQQ